MAFIFGPHAPGKYVHAEIKLVRTVENGVLEDVATGSKGKFYLNPDMIQESKASGWVKKAIPGLSDPHQQWIAGGARTITFKALVTNDRAEGHIPDNTPFTGAVQATTGKLSFVKKVAGIAAQVFNIPELSALGSLEAQDRNTGTSLLLSITEKLAFYRSLTYPRAFDANGAVTAPYLVRLDIGQTFGKGEKVRDAVFVVDKVEIEINRWLPDLTPIEAAVTFTMTEITNKSLTSDIDVMFNY